ncbi:M48 family metalloprotease [Daejeonella sp.]|uniref:M48 family metalloprotease n=1 Tax=Daejeonella sp. TaxID=2805397 RepID=UPI003982FEA0
MKRIVLFLLLCSQIAFAQKTNQCGILIPPPSKVYNFLSAYEAGAYVRTILDSVNWKQNFTLLEQSGINNAYATIIRNKRFIIYDNRFLTALDQYSNTNWASVSVLAHEIGHHYHSHLVSGNGSTPAKELEADYFSGYALAKIGASLGDATAAIQKIAPALGNTSHPGRAARVDAIQKGWYYAKGINTSSTTAARPAVPQPQQNPPPPVSESNWINLALYGNSAMTVYLSDDGRNYSPVLLKTTQPFVFKYEIYNYGFLRLVNSPNAETYKLIHNKDYSIIWNRRANNWTVVEVK